MTIVDDPSRLILVKHAQPEIVEGTPSALWTLSERGRASCRPLASRLAEFAPDLIVTSVEPKARETGEIVAQLLGIPLRNVSGSP